MTLRIDYTNMMGDVVDGRRRGGPTGRSPPTRFAARTPGSGGGATRASLDSSRCRPTTRCTASRPTSRRRARGKFDEIVVLGIGGSALGPIALRTALLEPAWNTLTKEERRGVPRLHVLDNVDPHTIAALLDRLNLDRTLFVVTSKSGGTAETMAQYLVVRGRLSEKVSDAADHLVFVTDPKKGALREIAANSDGIPAARHSAGRRRPIQRAHAGRHSAGGARRDGHGGPARRGARDRRALRHRRAGEESRRGVRDASVSSPTRSSVATSRC